MSASLHSCTRGVGFSLHAKEQVDLTASPHPREQASSVPLAVVLHSYGPVAQEQNNPERAALLSNSACVCQQDEVTFKMLYASLIFSLHV